MALATNAEIEREAAYLAARLRVGHSRAREVLLAITDAAVRRGWSVPPERIAGEVIHYVLRATSEEDEDHVRE